MTRLQSLLIRGIVRKIAMFLVQANADGYFAARLTPACVVLVPKSVLL